jgi:hypothetical protein
MILRYSALRHMQFDDLIENVSAEYVAPIFATGGGERRCLSRGLCTDRQTYRWSGLPNYPSPDTVAGDFEIVSGASSAIPNA